MPHWKSMMDNDYLCAHDLKGRDVTVTIEKVEAGKVVGEGGKKSKKPLCYFAEVKDGRPLALNATNCKTLTALFGSNNTDDWNGKRITLFPTTTQMGAETKECIRIRPQLPAEKVVAQ